MIVPSTGNAGKMQGYILCRILWRLGGGGERGFGVGRRWGQKKMKSEDLGGKNENGERRKGENEIKNRVKVLKITRSRS